MIDRDPVEDEAPLAAAVGGRLRALRHARQLTISELARRAGVGKATLSELEAGRRNPTLETLYALTTALDLPLSAALPQPAPATAREAIHGAAVDATLVTRLDDADAIVELYRISIRAGRRQRSVGHAAGVTEHLAVFSGVAIVGPESAPVRVGPGESVSWRADVDHLYTTDEGDVAAALLIHYPKPSAQRENPRGAGVSQWS